MSRESKKKVNRVIEYADTLENSVHGSKQYLLLAVGETIRDETSKFFTDKYIHC